MDNIDNVPNVAIGMPLLDVLRQRRRRLVEILTSQAETTGVIEVGHLAMLADIQMALSAVEAVDAEDRLGHPDPS